MYHHPRPQYCQVLIRPLLLQLGVLEEFEEVRLVKIDGLDAVSKLDIMLTPTAEAKRLHSSIVERCGVSNFKVLIEHLETVLQNMEEVVDLEPILRFKKAAAAAAQECHLDCSAEPFPHSQRSFRILV